MIECHIDVMTNINENKIFNRMEKSAPLTCPSSDFRNILKMLKYEVENHMKWPIWLRDTVLLKCVQK